MFNVSIFLRVLTIEVQRKADKIGGDQDKIYMFMMCRTSQSIKARKDQRGGNSTGLEEEASWKNRILLGLHEKEGNPAIYNNLDKT